MMRRLKGDKAKLALASILIQLANFAVLLLAKVAISVEQFAFLLTQLAMSGIVAGVASLRLEILVFQEHGRLTRAAALMPLTAVMGTITLSFALYGLASIFAGETFMLSMFCIPIMIGLALSPVLSFLLIQIGQLTLLLLARTAQAAGLCLLTAVLAFGLWKKPDGAVVLLLMGICYAVPTLIWLSLLLARIVPERADPPPLYRPTMQTVKRSASLSVSTAVNSAYVNIPLLAAAALQPVTFVADFGLILRCFTAPVTLIRQVIGQLFLAEAITWSTREDRRTEILARMISKAMIQSVGLYFLITPFLFSLLIFLRETLDIVHLDIAAFLFIAVLGQCAVNPVSHVRIPLSDERAFMYFDLLRLLGLIFGLYVLSEWIPFSIAFSTTTLCLYASYVLFIRVRVSRYLS